MKKVEIITKIYEYLRGTGVVHNIKDFARVTGLEYTNLTRAVKGNEDCLTTSLLIKINASLDNVFDSNWIKTGEGEMLASKGSNLVGDINVGDINNSSNVAVGHISKVVDESIKAIDDLSDKKRTAPLIPLSLMKRSTDLLEYIKGMEGVQRIYCGDLDIDAWVYVNDTALLPEYTQTDILGIKAYDNPTDIIPDNLYVVNTKSNGVVIRYLKFNDNGDFTAYTPSNNTQPFTIRQSDVIRVYRKVIMFRY